MAEQPTVARFLVSGPRPRLTSALHLAERVHLTLVRLSGGAEIFTGCDKSRRPLQGHGHAHIFCECNPGPERGRNGEVTHITVYAPMGFAPGEQEALQRLRDVWGLREDRISLALQGLGGPEDFGGPDASCGQCPLLAKSRAWVSRTPFVPTRHPKVTRAGVVKRDASGLQIGSPEHELRRLLRMAGFPEPVAVEPVRGTVLGGREVTWQDFLRQRENGDGRQAANGAGYGFRIQFPEPVQGPVAVGYGAHFGMGGFEGDPAGCIER
ncbi:MAG: type I-U CRISPR-associated protein Cas5/Cas6 [Methanothrix sp.]|nr:type I-U CRISPR-associated protein Cas5/Cas6 [Methanothrix sp.]